MPAVGVAVETVAAAVIVVVAAAVTVVAVAVVAVVAVAAVGVAAAVVAAAVAAAAAAVVVIATAATSAEVEQVAALAPAMQACIDPENGAAQGKWNPAPAGWTSNRDLIPFAGQGLEHGLLGVARYL